MAASKIAVLGIGNLLQKDEGVGIHIIRQLENRFVFEPEISLIDGGTMGTDLLPYFEQHDRIIIADAVNFDQPPGFIGSIENDDILRRLNTKLSIHHLGLTDVLSIARLLGIEPREIYLVGIQPEDISMGLELTGTITSGLERMSEAIRMKLSEWGVSSRQLE